MSDPPVSARRTLSEHDSKRRLADHGLAVAAEILVTTPAEAVEAAGQLGFPVVVKACGAGIAHKTERGLVRLGLADAAAVTRAAVDLQGALTPADGEVALLVAEMVDANRELIIGTTTDPVFGPTIMLGVGGILAEVVAAVAFRLLPLTREDAVDLIDDLAAQPYLGPFRGEPAVDRAALADALLAVAACATSDPEIEAIDVNPVLVVDGRPVAVDALVVVR